MDHWTVTETSTGFRVKCAAWVPSSRPKLLCIFDWPEKNINIFVSKIQCHGIFCINFFLVTNSLLVYFTSGSPQRHLLEFVMNAASWSFSSMLPASQHLRSSPHYTKMHGFLPQIWNMKENGEGRGGGAWWLGFTKTFISWQMPK